MYVPINKQFQKSFGSSQSNIQKRILWPHLQLFAGLSSVALRDIFNCFFYLRMYRRDQLLCDKRKLKWLNMASIYDTDKKNEVTLILFHLQPLIWILKRYWCPKWFVWSILYYSLCQKVKYQWASNVRTSNVRTWKWAVMATRCVFPF